MIRKNSILERFLVCLMGALFITAVISFFLSVCTFDLQQTIIRLTIFAVSLVLLLITFEVYLRNVCQDTPTLKENIPYEDC